MTKLCLKIALLCAGLMGTILAVAGDLYIDASDSSEITISSDALNGANAIVIVDHTPVAEPLLNAETNPKITAQQTALPYQNDVIAAAAETNLDVALINAVIAAESKHNRYAKSHKGAYGLMQLMPATAQRFGYTKKDSTQQNVMAGSKYLRELLGQFNGDLELALAAYNAGPAAVIKYQNQIPPYKETKQYVPKVLKYYRRFSS